jgi:hypothetical protein
VAPALDELARAVIGTPVGLRAARWLDRLNRGYHLGAAGIPVAANRSRRPTRPAGALCATSASRSRPARRSTQGSDSATLISERRIDIAQPNLSTRGGFSEAIAIAAIATANNVPWAGGFGRLGCSGSLRAHERPA